MLNIPKKVYFFCSGVLLWVRIKKDWRNPQLTHKTGTLENGASY